MQSVESRVAIHFSFGRHTHRDVPLLPKIRQEAEEFWGPPGIGRAIYWKEDVGASETLVRRFRNMVSEGYNLLDAYIQADHLSNPTLRRRLTPEEVVNARRFLLLEDGGTGNLEIDSMTAAALFLRREYQMLDEIARTRPLVYIPESCPDPVARIRQRQNVELFRRVPTIMGMLNQGSIHPKALQLYRENTIQTASTSRDRNISCLNTLTDVAREAERTGQPVRMFVRIGELHYPLVDRLNKRLSGISIQAEVTHRFDYEQMALLPEHKLILAIEADPKATFSKEEWIFALVGWVLENHLTNVGRPRPEMVTNINRALDHSTLQELETLVASFPKTGIETALSRFLASQLW